MGINSPLNDPIYAGGVLTDEVPATGPIAIAGHVYQIDPAKCSHKTLEVLRQSSDIGTEPGEQSLNTHGLWRRTAKDWRYGAGQVFFDEDTSVRNRCYASKGVDLLTTARQASLLPDTTLLLASANTNLQLVKIGAYAYLSDGANLRWSINGTSFPSSAAAGATIKSLATDGTNIYVAVGTAALQRAALGGALAAFGAFAADVVGYGNGRLIAAKANRIVELDAAGAITAFDQSHNNASFVWRGIVATPSAIYCWGDANGQSEVYAITVNGTTGGLNPYVWAWTVPAGETVNTMLWDVSVMAIGTSSGLRLATQASNNTLSAGAAIEISGGVTALANYRKYLWFSWSNFDATSTGLGRANLALLVEAQDLVPSYCSDLMATDQNVVNSIASYEDSRLFTVSGKGVYGQSANLVASGYIDEGWCTFSTIERKVAVSVDIRHDPLVGGSVSVSIDIDVDAALGGSRLQLSTSNQVNTLGPSQPFTSTNVPFERAKVIITLTRSAITATVGPVLRRMTFRAIPTPVRTDEIIVAIRMKSSVQGSVPNGMPSTVTQSVQAEFDYLKSLEAVGAIVRYQIGTRSYDVYLDGIEMQPTELTSDNTWFESIIGARMLTLTPAA